MATDADLLAINYRTLFVLMDSGQIQRENDPGQTPGPRLWFAGCASGNTFGLRGDVQSQVASEIAELIATEPPFDAPDGRPRHFERYVDLLSREEVAVRQSYCLMYDLPHHLKYPHGATLIDSESDEGQKLCATWSERGLPAGLLELGFKNVSDFWAPWCVAFQDGQVASVAIAARLSDWGAEVGISTARPFRGRGYAAAATAGWTRLKSLQSRALFYGADRSNVSSQRVTARLGLRRFGCSLRLI